MVGALGDWILRDLEAIALYSSFFYFSSISWSGTHCSNMQVLRQKCITSDESQMRRDWFLGPVDHSELLWLWSLLS
jgi:hypothetical protein